MSNLEDRRKLNPEEVTIVKTLDLTYQDKVYKDTSCL